MTTFKLANSETCHLSTGIFAFNSESIQNFLLGHTEGDFIINLEHLKKEDFDKATAFFSAAQY
jgi:hypothetical protein